MDRHRRKARRCLLARRADLGSASARRPWPVSFGDLVGLESTIIGLTDATPTLLRAGGIPVEAIEACLGIPLARPKTAQITAPGQMQSHYAPRAKVRLNAAQAQDGEIMLGFGAIDGALNLSPSGDLIEAASTLFTHLHQLDAQDRPIAVAPIPMRGLGLAINDRLRRAAAPR